MKSKRYIKDIGGKRYGRLEAVSFVKREKGKTYWLFKCDCGSDVIRVGSDVMRGKKQSCGCLNKDRIESLVALMKSRALPNAGSLKNRLYRNYKRAAKSRNISFDLTKEEFENMTTKNCYYCGDIPRNTSKESDRILVYNGIDRKVNSLGYSIKNCVPCCYVCNKMKLNLNEKEFLKAVSRIENFRNTVNKVKSIIKRSNPKWKKK